MQEAAGRIEITRLECVEDAIVLLGRLREVAHRIEKRQLVAQRQAPNLQDEAVFGILVVNVEQMFFPMLYANDPVSVVPGETMALPVWFFTDALFENKFLTLFSLLFGAGFALQ